MTAAHRRLAAAAALAACAGCGVPLIQQLPEPGRADRVRAARASLEEGRSFRRQGRHEAAERAARRGLAARPDDARLHRLLARSLDDLGRGREAARHWRRADRLDPPPPPPPDEALDVAGGILVVLLPPDPSEPDRVPRRWPEGEVADTLERRLRVRLPRATLVHGDPESVADARRWLPEYAPRAVLSLRVERAYCDDTIKDGPFAVAVLRVAAERPGPGSTDPERARETVFEPRLPGGCLREAVARALERALELEPVRAALAAPGLPAALRATVLQQARWSTPSIRALFPGIGDRIRGELAVGHRWLQSGRVAHAAEAFGRAAHLDPEDPDVRAYLTEAESTLALNEQLSGTGGEPGVLDPRLTPAQLAAAEARLAEERRRRDDLLAALAVLDEDVRAPAQRTLEALRGAEIRDPEAFGPALARSRAGGDVVARAAYAPDGSVLSRYYFASDGGRPVLREEDTNGDGRPDRWIGYEDGARREIWEDGSGTGAPGVHVVFAPGGTALERIELDAEGDGRLDRVFHYAAGTLTAEFRDTNGDGVLDRYDHFDASGNVVSREEDRDGDGQIDVRSIFRAGKLVRRLFTDPDAVPGDG